MSSAFFRSSIARRCLRAQTLNAFKALTAIAHCTAPPATFIQAPRCLLTLRSYTTANRGDCPGCGAPFQLNDPSKPGYLAPKKEPISVQIKKQQNKSLSDDEYQAIYASLDEESRALLGDLPVQAKEEQTIKRMICQRCHELHYHHKSTTESTPAFLRSSQQYGSLEFLKTKQAPLVVAVCDVTDLPGSLGDLPELLSHNPGARVHLAVNKFDILPKSSRRHEQRIRDWIVQHVKSLGLSTAQIASINLISAKKGWGVTGLMHRLVDDRRPTDDIYLIGCTNVGKSALVNRFMSQIRGRLDQEGRRLKEELKSRYQITSSAIPGTTMGTIKIPLHVLGMSTDGNKEDWEKRQLMVRERHLVDTPGVINENQLIHQLSFKDQKNIVNQSELNPITFKLEPGKPQD